jgi:hypothetical protein
MTDDRALGLRQNNPGNIDYSAETHWLGQMVPHPGGRFVWFVAPEWGMRAILVTLQTYQRRDGCKTVGDFIRRWAPSTENNVTAYLGDVCGRLESSLGFDVTEAGYIDMERKDECTALAQAITRHENGSQPYTDDQWTGAWELIAPLTGRAIS